MGNSVSSAIPITLQWGDEVLGEFRLAFLEEWFPRIARIRRDVLIESLPYSNVDRVDLLPDSKGNVNWADKQKVAEFGGLEMLRHVVKLYVRRCQRGYERWSIETKLHQALFPEDYSQHFQSSEISDRVCEQIPKNIRAFLSLLESIIEVGRALGCLEDGVLPVKDEIRAFYETHSQSLKRSASPHQALRFIRIGEIIRSRRIFNDFMFTVLTSFPRIFPLWSNIKSASDFFDIYGKEYRLSRELCTYLLAKRRAYDLRERQREEQFQNELHHLLNTRVHTPGQPFRETTTLARYTAMNGFGSTDVMVVPAHVLQRIESSAVSKFRGGSRRREDIEDEDFILLEVRATSMNGRNWTRAGNCGRNCRDESCREYAHLGRSRDLQQTQMLQEISGLSELARQHAERALRVEKRRRHGVPWDSDVDDEDYKFGFYDNDSVSQLPYR